MTRSEFQQVAENVFAELLPKVKVADRDEAIQELITELQANALDIEDDEVLDEDQESDEGDED